MDEARKVVDKVPEGTVILADEQTSGRGSLDRKWVSPKGNLYMSLVLNPSLKVLPKLSLMTSLAIVNTLKKFGLSAKIKWPNDVLVGGKKISGVLIETGLKEGDRWAIVGIGVNLNFDPDEYPEIKDIATSLKKELGREVGRDEFMNPLLEEIEELYLRLLRGESLREEWKEKMDSLGKNVRVRFGDDVEEGFAEDIDEDGFLLLRKNGEKIKIPAGEIV